MHIVSNSVRDLPALGLLLAVAMLVAGCASRELPPGPCHTLDCVVGQTIESEVENCTNHLFWYERYPRTVRRDIDSTYRYPARSSRSYRTMQQLGYRVTSPQAWCEAHTDARLGRSLARRTY
jgi:hypothetical protein